MRIRITPPVAALGLASLLIAASMCPAAPAFAYAHVETTGCDTLSMTPFRVRTTFTIPFVSGSYCDFELQPRPAGPAPGDSTHFYDCGAPAPWQCAILPLDGVHGGPQLLKYSVAATACTGLGGAGFSVVTNQTSPCALFYWLSGLPDDSGSWRFEGCLVKDGPVPTTPTSWGSLYSRYH